MMKMELRRFEIIDEAKEDKLLKLIKSKNLSREDLMIILKTIKLRENTDKESLKDIPINELVKELECRKGVQTFQDRLYQEGYNINIVKKFSEDRTPVQLPINATVLVIED